MIEIVSVDLDDGTGTSEAGAVVSATIKAADMDGAIPVGKVEADGERVAVLVVFPAADVDLLVPASLGAVVKAAIQSVAG